MKTIFPVILLFFALAGVAHAEEDSMKEVFDRISDLIVRVESGISLNSYAEALAEMKISFRKAKESESVSNNLLLNDRMKEVMKILDDYATAWKAQENDKYRYMAYPPASAERPNRCYVQISRYQSSYEIACIKELILNRLKDQVEPAKSAHYNGW